MRYPLLAVVSVCALAVSAAAQQSPAPGAKNLHYFPKDIQPRCADQRMRTFSFALDGPSISRIRSCCGLLASRAIDAAECRGRKRSAVR